MATGSLVLCSPLCFLRSKFGKSNGKVLKSATIDFFSDMDIKIAKQQLLADINRMDLTEQLPHIPTRREGNDRLVREVDDVITLFTLLDERKLLDALPTYVSDSPDNMPSTRLYEGDIKVVMDHLNRMDEKMAAFGSTLFGVVHDIHTLQTTLASRPQDIQLQAAPQRPVVNNDVIRSQQVNALTAGNSRVGSLTSRSTTTTVAGSSSAAVVQQVPLRPSWENIMSASAASAAVTASSDINVPSTDYDSHTEPDEPPYTVVRSKKRRRRGHSQQLTEDRITSNVPLSYSAAAAAGHSSHPGTNQTTTRTRRNGPLLVGKRPTSATNTSGTALVAARQFPKKSVFYVDNVDCSVDVDDLKRFVAGLSVHVVSCFEVEPRKRRSERGGNEAPISKAFRLCIYENACELLLDPSKWPAYVRISEWFFKPAGQQHRTEQRVSTPVNSLPSPPSVIERPNDADVLESEAPTDENADIDSVDDQDVVEAMDSTVIVADLSDVNVLTVS
jgi:hypothetical protein